MGRSGVESGPDILPPAAPWAGPGCRPPVRATAAPRTRQAVCILTAGQDHWGVAYSTFVLAKQAGFDLEFQYATQPIREADLYLLPCLSGHAMISRRRLHGTAGERRGGRYAVPVARQRPAQRLRADHRPGAADPREAPRLRPDRPAGSRRRARTSHPAGSSRCASRPTRAEVLGCRGGRQPGLHASRPTARGRVYFLVRPDGDDGHAHRRARCTTPRPRPTGASTATWRRKRDRAARRAQAAPDAGRDRAPAGRRAADRRARQLLARAGAGQPEAGGGLVGVSRFCMATPPRSRRGWRSSCPVTTAPCCC